MKGVNVVHISGKFHINMVFVVAEFLIFKSFRTSRSCGFRLLLGAFLARNPPDVVKFV